MGPQDWRIHTGSGLWEAGHRGTRGCAGETAPSRTDWALRAEPCCTDFSIKLPPQRPGRAALTAGPSLQALAGTHCRQPLPQRLRLQVQPAAQGQAVGTQVFHLQGQLGHGPLQGLVLLSELWGRRERRPRLGARAREWGSPPALPGPSPAPVRPASPAGPAARPAARPAGSPARGRPTPRPGSPPSTPWHRWGGCRDHPQQGWAAPPGPPRGSQESGEGLSLAPLRWGHAPRGGAAA